MIKIKIKVLEKVSDGYGVTIVMRRYEIEKTRWWKPGKLFKVRIITIFTALDEGLIRWPNYNALKDWLIVDPNFRYYEKDHLDINIRGILKDKEMIRVATRLLTV